MSPVERSVPRALLPTLALLIALTGLLHAAATPVIAQAQTQTQARADELDRREAARAALELSRLEAERDFDELYERMHPDAKAVVPRAVVVGWYEADFADKRTAELDVTGVEFISWTWGVTGETYRRTAAVAFVQPYWVDGVRSDVPGVVHLVEEDETWGWFFGGSRAFVDQQIAAYAPEEQEEDAPRAPAVAGAVAPAYVSPFLDDHLHAHVDAFWARQFAAADRVYDPPDGVVGLDAPAPTACGRADPRRTAAFYCGLADTIYYRAEFRAAVEAGVGDFGWVVVVAHEWGHHVQLRLGFLEAGAPGQVGDFAPIELEQQADCLAGAYTRYAEATAWLDPGDVEEALVLTELAGDPVGTPWDDPFAHGSGEERVAAFLDGYEGGLAACDLEWELASG